MKKVVSSVSIGLALVALTAAGVLACGGPDKPPMTPDVADPTLDGPDGGAAPAPSAPATPAH